MSQSTPAERREYLKTMDTEWQTLFKNQAATAQARQRWPDRAMDTRWARIDPDLLDIESHSATLTGKAL